MAKYICAFMKFVKVRGNKDYYLGECNDDSYTVYIPTLNKYFSYDDVYLGEKLSGDHLDNLFGLSKKVKVETDDFGYVSSYINGTLSGFDIRRIEKEYNRNRGSSNIGNKFVR